MAYILKHFFRGFIAVWTRQEQYELVLVIILYVLPRIAAVSQEHVLTCVTRRVTRPEMTWF